MVKHKKNTFFLKSQVVKTMFKTENQLGAYKNSPKFNLLAELALFSYIKIKIITTEMFISFIHFIDI